MNKTDVVNPLAEEEIAEIAEIFAGTDWELLREQKKTLLVLELQYRLRSGNEAEHVSGVIAWIDILQDVAHKAGYPVLFLEEEQAEEVSRG